MQFFRFDQPGRLKLDEIPTSHDDSITKSEAKERFEELNEELFGLQDLMWAERCELINAFERTLVQGNCIILKYFLHITEKEQEKRLLAREKDPNGAWKLNVEDWREREMWDAFTRAYQDAIGRCAAKDAPWIVVPADAKW